MTQEEGQKVLDKWYKKMRLAEWDIELCMLDSKEYDAKVEELGDPPDLVSNGYCALSRYHKSAVIYIRADAEDPQFAIVHELTHLLIDGIYCAWDRCISMVDGKKAQGILSGDMLYENECAINKIVRLLLEIEGGG